MDNGEIVTKASVMREIKFYKDRIKALEERELEVVEREVIPDDYEELKSQLASAEHEANRLEKDFQRARQKIADQAKTVDALKARIGADKTVKDADRDIRYFTDATHDYIRRYGGHVWSFEQIQNVDEGTRTDFINAIKTLDGFAQQLIRNLEGNISE
jgi:predicted O-linked N-acetylglucosamine transferase (SPINDLY family)